jgi:hypothetical protein
VVEVRVLTDLDERPEELRGVLLPFAWELERLLALDLVEHELTVSEFEWMLELPLWREHVRPFVVTPNQVRAEPDAHSEQRDRTLGVELCAPVHVTEREGRLVIIDGIHRLLRASMERIPRLPARLLPVERWPQIATQALVMFH